MLDSIEYIDALAVNTSSALYLDSKVPSIQSLPSLILEPEDFLRHGQPRNDLRTTLDQPSFPQFPCQPEGTITHSHSQPALFPSSDQASIPSSHSHSDLLVTPCETNLHSPIPHITQPQEQVWTLDGLSDDDGDEPLTMSYGHLSCPQCKKRFSKRHQYKYVAIPRASLPFIC